MKKVNYAVNGTTHSFQADLEDRDYIIDTLGRKLCRKFHREYVRSHCEESRAMDGSYCTVQFTLGDSLYKQTKQRSDMGTTTNIIELHVTLFS